jgi:transcription elongation factor GreA
MKELPPTLADVAVSFISGLPGEQRELSQQEVARFIRWCGKERRPSDLTPQEIAEYGTTYLQHSASNASKLDPVGSFLAYLRKEGLVKDNLVVHLRIRKPAEKKNTRAPETTERQPRVVDLTQEGYEALAKEVEALKAQRPHIAEEIRKAAADKDFRENAPYHAAREHLSQVESRIRELEETVKGARIVNIAEGQNGRQIKMGSRVRLRDLGAQREVIYILVSPKEVDPKAGKISTESPLGKMLLDRIPGQEVEVRAPGGVMRYRIEEVGGLSR